MTDSTNSKPTNRKILRLDFQLSPPNRQEKELPEVGKQTKPIVPYQCTWCKSYDTTMRLPRDTQKGSWVVCRDCDLMVDFP